MLTQETPYTEGYSYKTRTGGGNAPAMGEASCAATCSPSECEACLHALANDLYRICNSALSARVESQTCMIHYDSTNF
jgi:hypothetical protein